MNNNSAPAQLNCPICGYSTDTPRPQDMGTIRGNTERFLNDTFTLWKCPECSTIINLEPLDFADIYSDYPLNKRQLDLFARGTLKNLTGRLQRAGMTRDNTILDYGCGNGVYIHYLKEHGYPHVTGYDPYVPEYAERPDADAPFDVVINNDTVEHCRDVYGMIQDCLERLKPGGLLYVGTADSAPVDMTNLEVDMMRLHQPFHTIVMTEQSLHKVVREFDVEIIASYRRSYHDTLRPFANYRFLDELNKTLGHNLDKALDPAASTRAFLRTPRLWFFALFGYWFPSAAEPAVIVRKRKQ